jgi:transcriptional regulator with XRE-family HTH domain
MEPKPSNPFGIALRKICTDRGISQADLVKSMGISNSSMSEYFTGKVDPTAKRILAFATAIGCDPGALLRDPDLPVDPYRDQLFDRLRKLDNSQLRLIDSLLKGIEGDIVDSTLQLDEKSKRI